MGDSHAGDGSAPQSEERPPPPSTPHFPLPTPYSPLQRILRLTRKELSEILRDRRTIVTLVAMPLLLYPLLSVAFLQFAWLGKSHAERGTSYICGFATRAEAELFFYRLDRGRGNRDEGKLEAA